MSEKRARDALCYVLAVCSKCVETVMTDSPAQELLSRDQLRQEQTRNSLHGVTLRASSSGGGILFGMHTIIYMDLDAFFCAMEKQRDPALRGKPFAVGGQAQERGVVASCSWNVSEAASIGVPGCTR